MIKLPLLTKSIFIFIIIFEFMGCTSDNYYNTTNLNEATQQIQDTKQYLISVKDSIRSDKCPEIALYDAMIKKEEELYTKIKTWITDSVMHKIPKIHRKKVGKLLSEKNRIIQIESIPYPGGEDFRVSFQKQIKELERELFELDSEFKHYRVKIERCARNYGICQELLASGSTSWRVKNIKKLLKFYMESEEQNQDDSVKIYDYIRSNKLSKKTELRGEVFIDLQTALSYHLKYKITNDSSSHCRNAHLWWNSLLRRYDKPNNEETCQIEFLEKESRKWQFLANRGITIDSVWVRIQRELTGKCSPPETKRGCPYECATNYDPTVGIDDNFSCQGCKDPKAANYCPNMKKPDKCIYLICTDDCYEEFGQSIKAKYPLYDPSKGDMLVPDPAACITNICGCTDNRCENYSDQAKRDDGTCNCACLNETAVNYLPDSLGVPDPKLITFKSKDTSNNYMHIPESMELAGRVYYHVEEICHWRGCLDSCALNFNPKAKEPDKSCKCSPTTKEELQAILRYLEFEIAARKDPETANKVDALYKRSQGNLPNDIKRITKQFKVSQQGPDLVFSANIKITKKIRSDGVMDGIPIGKYTFDDLYIAVDHVIDFMEQKAGGLDNFYGVILGEADGHPVTSGIPFWNNHQNISSEEHRLLKSDELIDIKRKKKSDFGAMLNSNETLNHGGEIKTNEILAFVRGYLIKQRMLISLGSKIANEDILVCARANKKRGGRFRRVSLSFTIDNYFKDYEKSFEEVVKERDRVRRAITYYDRYGYPEIGSSITYKKCPCYESK